MAVYRFAPSPNGALHLGHALSALLNADAARASGARMLLRFEDIDATRCRPEYERAIEEDLAWLGIAWERPVRRQSEHFDDYRAALARLGAMGLVYPSFESRAEIAALAVGTDPDGAPLYAGSGKTLHAHERAARVASGAPYALRLDMENALARAVGRDWPEGSPRAWGDVVLARKDVPTSYHLSVVVDDAIQGVTHVVRGEDLARATGVHRLLQSLLGLPTPHYRHHRLVLDSDGRKLAKSNGATGLRALREAGLGPGDVRRMVGLPAVPPGPRTG